MVPQQVFTLSGVALGALFFVSDYVLERTKPVPQRYRNAFAGLEVRCLLPIP
jgi:uncharacterized membrane protein (UPF0136 family)